MKRTHNGNYLLEEEMIWIGIWIGGFTGMLIMALLQIGKISDLYREIEQWKQVCKKCTTLKLKEFIDSVSENKK